jgi:uncharacterized membrane protein YbhN (UPF0104 family)
VSALLATVGALVGGSLGWWLGARVGPITAVAASALGTGVGLYAGRRLAARLSE